MRGLVRESGVNKNTFYYHFEGVDDLARQATEEILDPAFLEEMLSQMQGTDVQSRAQDPGFQKCLGRVRTIARAKGTPELQDALRWALARTWAATVGFDLAMLDQSQRIALEFALGGIMSILAYTDEDGSEPTPEQVIASSVPQAVAVVFGSLPA